MIKKLDGRDSKQLDLFIQLLDESQKGMVKDFVRIPLVRESRAELQNYADRYGLEGRMTIETISNIGKMLGVGYPFLQTELRIRLATQVY